MYALVRHPLYLGWSLSYVAVALFSQHWLIAAVGLLGMGSMYLISREEDRRLMEKFGEAYAQYGRSVPAMNFLVGMARSARRGKRVQEQR